MSDFHQEVTFKLYFTSTSSLCFWVQIVCLFVCLSVFWCLDYSRINEQIFIKKFLWVETGQRKKLQKERSGSYFEFSEVPFQCIFNEFGFLLDSSSKINLHVWFYFIVFLTILYITLETGHMESSVLLSLSASCYLRVCYIIIY